MGIVLPSLWAALTLLILSKLITCNYTKIILNIDEDGGEWLFLIRQQK